MLSKAFRKKLLEQVVYKSFSSNGRLMNISPLDGRYSKQVDALRPYFSEYALMRMRVYVELEWYKRLFSHQIVQVDAQTATFVKKNEAFLDDIFAKFDEKDGERVKEIERTTNHDVKAIEYFLKEKF